MPLIFKLIYPQTIFEIRDDYEGPINLSQINDLFLFWELQPCYIEKIKFITNNQQITDPTNNIIITNNEDTLIYVLTSDNSVKEKLKQIFIKNGIPQEIKIVQNDLTINKPLVEDIIDVEPQLTPEIIESMNKKTVLLFSDPDFKNLIKIYLKNPDLFNIFSQYIMNGNIVEETDNVEITEELKLEYNLSITKIIELGIDIEYDIILQKLIKHKGHINLTVRELLM